VGKGYPRRRRKRSKQREKFKKWGHEWALSPEPREEEIKRLGKGDLQKKRKEA